MKRTFWDVLVDCNSYRIFTPQLDVPESLELNEKLKTESISVASWMPLRIELWEGDKPRAEKKKPIADFIDTGLLIKAVNPRTRTLVEPLIASQVEFLLFESPFGPYYGLHLRYVDCLDAEHSEVIRFKSSGRIMEVERYSFHWDRLADIHIFHLPELGLSRLFVSDEFKRVVELNGLTGLIFYPVPLAE